jgi:hypothetical protein
VQSPEVGAAALCVLGDVVFIDCFEWVLVAVLVGLVMVAVEVPDLRLADCLRRSRRGYRTRRVVVAYYC